MSLLERKNVVELHNIEAPELAVYHSVSEVQLLHYYEPAPGLFIAESPKVIARALQAGYVPISFLVEKKQLEQEQSESAVLVSLYPDTPVYTAEFSVLTKLTGFQLTRGMLCVLHRKELASVEQVCRNMRRVAVLEDVVNPTNIGAIFRSAAALNMDAVLLTASCCDPFYRRSARVSMGTVFQIPWTYFPKEKEGRPYYELLRELGFRTTAMALRNDSVSINDPVFQTIDKLAIILGTEGEGLRSDTIDFCDYTVKIPMSHHVDSLNVAAASAVAFWELGK